MKEYIKPTIVLGMICLVITAFLAVTFNVTQPIIEENNRLYQFIADLYAESRAKITMANQRIEAANGQILETTRDAADFAQHIVDTEGVPTA